MNFNETCDLNSDLLSISGGVVCVEQKIPLWEVLQNPHELSCQKYNQNNLVFRFFSPNVPVISASPPLPELWLLIHFGLSLQRPSVLLRVEMAPGRVRFMSEQSLGKQM